MPKMMYLFLVLKARMVVRKIREAYKIATVLSAPILKNVPTAIAKIAHKTA